MNVKLPMSREESIAFYQSCAWLELSDLERAYVQFENGLCCMPFSVFHRALSATVGATLFSHQIAQQWEYLRQEVRERYQRSETASPPRPAVST